MNDATQFFNTTAGGGYQIERSLRFNSSDSAFLSRTPSSSGNRRTWTFATWIKGPFNATDFPRVLNVEGPSAGYRTTLRFTSGSLIEAYSYDGSNFQWQLTSSQVFRDPSAWFHLLLAVDTTQATSSNRVKLYINGVQVTAFSTANYPSLNFDTAVNHTSPHTIGGGQALSAYLADVFLIDGQALDPSAFVETSATTGQLVPKQYTGSFGTNGFWLKFSDNSAATATTLGKDYSGNSNNWTPNNLSVTAGAGNDSLVDTPSSYGTDTGAGGEVRGNYATLNPAAPIKSTTTISNGALDTIDTTAQGSGDGISVATVGVSAGKWYWEITALDITGTPSNQRGNVGLVKNLGSNALSTYLGANANSYGYYSGDGSKATNGSGSAYGATWQTNDVIGVALNLDAGTLVFYKNGVSQGTAFSSLNTGETYFPACSLATNGKLAFNFGQRQWAYAAPAGFKALCDTNLPAPVVAKPSEVMDAKTYSGTGTNSSSTQAITGFGFSPDLVWIKARSVLAGHAIYDQIRGTNSRLSSSQTNAEFTGEGFFSSFDSAGFTVAGNANNTNASGETYVAWTWDAGSSTVTNTQGSITSTVRASASSGFSIVSWTNPSSGSGAFTVGHSLGISPSLILIKARGASSNWNTFHSSVCTDTSKFLNLNTTDALLTYSGLWGSSLPTSSVFGLGNNFRDGNTMVAYCFAPVAGYSSFGSYTGNGSSDGPFVFCGFRPRWIMIKRTDSAVSWNLFDTARDSYNAAGLYLFPNLSNAESDGRSANGLDILSNGFKWRSSGSGENASGGTFIYFAVAESPFAYSRAR